MRSNPCVVGPAVRARLVDMTIQLHIMLAAIAMFGCLRVCSAELITFNFKGTVEEVEIPKPDGPYVFEGDPISKYFHVRNNDSRRNFGYYFRILPRGNCRRLNQRREQSLEY